MKRGICNDNALIKLIIDSGSTVNVIPKREIIKQGLSIEKSNVRSVNGFNESSSDVLGRITMNVKIRDQVKKITFLIIDDAKRIMLGRPELTEFKWKIDFDRACLESENGNIIYCNLMQKN